MVADRQKIQNEGDSRKYFTMMLNMADDDLDPYEYRLLAHYVRYAGYNAEYEEGIRQTAKVTRMGTVKVRKTRQALVSKGYLTVVEPTKEAQALGEAVAVTVVDRWAENILRYAKGVSNSTQGGVSDSTHLSEKPVSDSTQGGVSNSTPKNNYKTQEPIQEQKEEKQHPTNVVVGTINPVYVYTDLIKAWLDASQVIDPAAYSKKTHHQLAQAMLKSGVTPDDIRLFIEHRRLDKFWKDKAIRLNDIASSILAWKSTHFAPKAKPYDDTYTPPPPEEQISDEQKAEVGRIMDSLYARFGVRT